MFSCSSSGTSRLAPKSGFCSDSSTIRASAFFEIVAAAFLVVFAGNYVGGISAADSAGWAKTAAAKLLESLG